MFSKFFNKKIFLDKKIISNKYQKINISLTNREIKVIKNILKKYNQENLIKLKVL